MRRWLSMRNSIIARDSGSSPSRSNINLAIRTLSTGVVRRIGPLADVVIEEREHQVLRRREVSQQSREAAAARGRRGRERLEISDREQRVLVDGVLVIEVAHHARENRLELRKHPPEQAAVVHFRQPRVEARPRLEKLQQASRSTRGRKEVLGGVAVDVLLDERQRFVGDDRILVERRLKHVQPGVRLARRALHVDEANAVAGSHQVRADRTWRDLARPFERSADDPGVAEVVAHQPLDPLLRLRAGIAEQLRRLFLQFVGQDVLIAVALEMHDRPDAEEEVLRLVQARRVGRAMAEQRRVGEPRDRADREQIPQRAGRVLRVRLELIEGAVELRVPLVDERLQQLEDGGVRLGPVERGEESAVEPGIAHDAARVEQREQELWIVGFEPREVAELAHLMPDDERQIPERVEKSPQKSLVVANRPLEQDQDIDVGVEREVSPPVSTERDDRRRLRGRRSLEEQPLQERVDPIGVALECGTVGAAPAGLFDELLTGGREPGRNGVAGQAIGRRHRTSSSDLLAYRVSRIW